MSDLFTGLTVSSGGCLFEPAVFISELYGQPVQLQHEQSCVTAAETAQIRYLLCLVQR